MIHVLILCLSLLFTSPVLAIVPESPSADRYTTNGTGTQFPYTFKVYAKTDLAVYLDNALKTIDVDYTVSGVASDGGGVVTFLTPPATGLNVTILRSQPNQQYSVYTQNGFNPRQAEKDLDKLAMQVQELREQLTRALKFLPSSTATSTVEPPVVGSFARAKVGGGVDWATPTNAGALSSPVPIADGGTGAITAGAALTALGAAPDTGSTVINAKGDLLAGTADNAWGRVPVGADGAVLTASSAQSTGLSWVASGAALLSTGDVKFTIKNTADSGWIMMNDGTIGNATSGATTRANADTQALYNLIWNDCADQWCPVSGGRGATGNDDFTANKQIQLPMAVGRTLSVWHASSGPNTVAAGSNAQVDTTANALTVPSNLATWITAMPVTFTLTSGSITGLTSGSTYYVIRINSTTIKLASTLNNAQIGTAIDFTAKSSPVWSMRVQTNARSLGEYLGEEAHAMSGGELLLHNHTSATGTGAVGGGGGSLGIGNTGNTGGNGAMNSYQPTLVLGLMVKL